MDQCKGSNVCGQALKINNWLVCSHYNPFSIPFDLIKEYDFDRNINIRDITNETICWWQCSISKCNCHIFKATVKSRLEDPVCPFCCGSMQCFHDGSSIDQSSDAGDHRGQLLHYWTNHPSNGKRYWWKYIRNDTPSSYPVINEYYGTYWNNEAHGLGIVIDQKQKMARISVMKGFSLVVRFET